VPPSVAVCSGCPALCSMRCGAATEIHTCSKLSEHDATVGSFLAADFFFLRGCGVTRLVLPEVLVVGAEI
jgi:hypothetical protein